VAEFTKLNRKPAGNSPANINVGDSVELFVMEDNSFNGIYKIREKGDIIVPKIGRIVIHGMTVEAAQSRIRQVLLSSQLTAATVILDRVSSSGVRNFAETPKMLVFVTGKVNKPGQHMIAVENGNPVLAYEALLIAGGTTPFADEKRSYILRRGGQGSRQKNTAGPKSHSSRKCKRCATGRRRHDFRPGKAICAVVLSIHFSLVPAAVQHWSG